MLRIVRNYIKKDQSIIKTRRLNYQINTHMVVAEQSWIKRPSLTSLQSISDRMQLIGNINENFVLI